MKKGVKKIKWTGKGEVSATHSKPDSKLTAKGDHFVFFKIDEWEEGTTELEKGKNVFWHFQTNRTRETVLQTTKPYNQDYGIKIPKKLCGPYCYYLEASIPSLSNSKKAGLMVGGWCEQKILKSKWSTTNDGEDVGKSHVFSYGNTIHLNLDTEGLNGYTNLIVDIYRKGEDDTPIKVYTSVDVADGEVNLSISDTLSWYGKIKGVKKIEEFYVKVRNPVSKKYIPNGNNETKHAAYLQIKNKLEPSFSKPPTNQTALKVGELDTYHRNAGHCNFKKIVLYQDDEPITIFDEGKFNRQISGKDRFITIRKIHYDFDKYNIRQDAKATIDGIAKFLKESPYIPVEIGSHTDCRGTDEYNDTLSKNRAKTIVDSLVKSGIAADRITAKGYGKTMLQHRGENISEALHEQNRRTTLLLKVYGNNAIPINIDVIAPSQAHVKKLKLKVPDQQFKGCFKEEKSKHNINKNVIENTQISFNKITPYSTDTIEHPIFSIINSDFSKHYVRYLSKFLIPFDSLHIGDITNDYYFYINSCAYYSDKTMPTLHIKTYPDVIWMGHFQYNYKTKVNKEDTAKKAPFYFHEHTVDLKNGIGQEIKELTESIFGKLMVLMPGGWLTQKVLFPYVESQSEFYDLGLHAIYDRTLEKKAEALSLKGIEVDFIKTDDATRYIAAFVIYELVAIGIIIDLLMIYLTRGKSAEGKLAKIATKIKKISKYLDDAGAELVPPSIAINAGMYYKTQLDNKLALIFEANVKADPLVAINFEKKFDLKDLITEKLKHKDNQKKQEEIKAFLKTIKTNLTATLSLIGEIAIDQSVQYNVLTNTHTITDKLGNLVQNNTVTYKKRVKGTMLLEGNFSKKFFEFSPLKTEIDGNITLKMACESLIQTEYGYNKKDNKGLFMEKKLIFSGLKGTFLGEINIKNKTFGKYEYSTNEGKPIHFTLFDSATYSLGKINFFNTESKK